MTLLPVEIFWLKMLFPFKTLSVVLKNTPEKLLHEYLIRFYYRLISPFNECAGLGKWQQPEKHVVPGGQHLFKQQPEDQSPEPRNTCCCRAPAEGKSRTKGAQACASGRPARAERKGEVCTGGSQELGNTRWGPRGASAATCSSPGAARRAGGTPQPTSIR